MTREELEEYKLLNISIERCKRKLEHYLLHPLKTEHGTVQASMSEFPYCRTHLEISGTNIADERDRDVLIRTLVLEIATNQRLYDEKRLYIDLWLESLEDLEQKEILSMKYCDNMTDSEIGEVLGYERSTISKRIDSYFHTNHNE